MNLQRDALIMEERRQDLLREAQARRTRRQTQTGQGSKFSFLRMRHVLLPPAASATRRRRTTTSTPQPAAR